jgi:hypothetical protein
MSLIGLYANLLIGQMEQAMTVILSRLGDLLTVDSPAPPATLYHYTTTDGLLEIFSSRTLWASRVHNMNDRVELEYGRRMMRDVVRTRIEGGSLSQPVRKILSGAFEPRLAEMEPFGDPYVVCFCEEGDLLSQSRGYAAAGYSIGVKVPDLRWGKVIFRVIYDPDEQKAYAEKVVDLTAARLQDSELFLDEPDLALIFTRMVGMALEVAGLRLKDPGFREEKEWRSIQLAPAGSHVLFRQAQNRLIPYLPIPFSERAADQTQEADESAKAKTT